MRQIDVAVGIALRASDGAVLVARRPDTAHQGGKWEFPGGKREAGETPEQTLCRELIEEVGLEASVLEAWPAVEHVYPERRITLFPFLCAAQGEAFAMEAQEIRWVAISDLRPELFPEANAVWIARLQIEADRIVSLVRASFPREPGPA